jgi:type IV pilus assembly protein PilO
VALQLKQLEGKPWYYGLGIGLVLGGLFYAVANFYWPNFQEMRRVIEQKKGELNALNEKITQGRAAERRLPQLREEVRRIELDLQRLVQILPTKRNTEELIKKVEALTRQGDFFLKRFAPKDYINREFYAEWPIDVQLDGTYHNLALFFARVARFSRIINIDDLVMNGINGAGKTIAANFTMKTFIYLGDQEQPAQAGPQKRGPGGRRGGGG